MIDKKKDGGLELASVTPEEIVKDESTVAIDENFLTEEEIIETEMRKRQIASLRNKVYIFFLALFLFMFWPTFLTPIEKIRGEDAFKIFTANPVESMFHRRGEGWLLSNIEKVEEDIEAEELEIQKTQIEKEVVKHLSNATKQQTLINCLNYDVCSNISEALIKELDFLRVFLTIWWLSAEKMTFNQKDVLRSMNEYMLMSPTGELYWNLNSINFAWVNTVNDTFKLNRLRVSMNIEFSNVDSLYEFLDNVENKVFTELPMMYVIERMTYDIQNYDQPQIIWVDVSLYYFTWELDAT